MHLQQLVGKKKWTKTSRSWRCVCVIFLISCNAPVFMKINVQLAREIYGEGKRPHKIKKLIKEGLGFNRCPCVHNNDKVRGQEHVMTVKMIVLSDETMKENFKTLLKMSVCL